ncbi:MAG: xanthine dehydrogenase family protein molybdopterin-binding subunit, partial [Rhodospirillales bacterium]|nr:xanthine dehydrogenase family protein molybdopterin-binding subunit [Rhodospirillales bacterium]
RKAGATARALLVQAAAKDWKVAPEAITVEKGVLSHPPSGRSAGFGDFAAKAAALPVPSAVKLKDPKDFRLIGQRLPRVDTAAKVDGSAGYASDLRLPGMLTALVLRPPRFGAKLKSLDPAAALAVKGVEAVFPISSGVAVVAQSFWTAKTGREALKVVWDEGGERRGSEALLAEYRALAQKPGLPARREGDAEAALAKAARVLTAEYTFPYLAHAPMEPLSCVVRLEVDRCEIWAGDQFQTGDQANAARVAGLKPEQVGIHTLYAGGSFGRRANPVSDYVVEAVEVAKGLKGRAPVKLLWTREDDITGGRYRPMYVHALAAGLDESGKLVAWRHRIVGQSILAGTPFAKSMVKDGIDKTSVEGASDMPYVIPNLSVELHSTEVGVPVLWWRSVGHSHTAHATECFLDEVAAAGGQDPVTLRRAVLGAEFRRERGVLDLAVAKAGWDKPLPAGWGRGVAVHKSFSSHVAQVAEVSVSASGAVKVERVVCAVDCGIAVNPDVIAAQIEGGIGFGAALHGAVTLKDGVVEQTNFDSYRVLRMDEMPKVEVHIVPSAETPTGIGEPGVPPLAPALANAIHAATGRRLRSLPLDGGMQA